ncbi:hypothetical protein [Psychroflexus salis]|uniref:Uncharacterized protein n=1 Tax=Psychroflexus salis TaxID=1526574 RepID=A0A916ZU79_9FLAO|nr:hypothetical protein [Psychroflexus salis]GGE14056.1 hypothetical protein GCM10010831_14280 [Psychroflexus salis]
MVKIVDYVVNENNKGEEFCSLIVQGGVEKVTSKETGRSYLTVRKARVACTFDEITCKGLVGTELPGEVSKVQVEPYEYIVPSTGEVIEMNYSWRYLDEEDAVIKDQVVEQQSVA